MENSSTTATASKPDSGSTSNSDASQAAMQAMMVQITTDGVPKLHCPVCNKALISLNGYVKHLKKHEPPGGFFCRYCDDRFCTDEELKKHRDAVHTTIACRICKDITFTNEDEYREHIRVVHNGIDREIYKCEKCGAEYKTPESFKRHQANQCGTIKPFKCDECEMAFYTKYNLKQHKITHSGERRFCCSYCGKNFLQKARLVEHERSHTGEKPYKCDVCGKCFAHRESIVTHSSIHTGIKLVECRCCLSRFSCHSNLIKHRRSRPDTCGLPEYNPPKNLVRTRKSRIPPTMNPTSEIKVSNLNKIIKPADKMLEKKGRRLKVDSGEEKPKVKRAPRRRKQLATESEAETTSEDEDNSETDGHDTLETRVQTRRHKNIPPTTTSTSEDPQPSGKINSKIDAVEKPVSVANVLSEDESYAVNQKDFQDSTLKSNTMGNSTTESVANDTTVASNSLKAERKPIWSDDSDSADYYPDFDTLDTESDPEHKTEIKIPLPKVPIKKEKVEETTINDFEYTNANEFVNAELSVKSEDEQNIFNEKDKLLDCLLNDNEGSTAYRSTDNNSTTNFPSFDIVKVESLLDESEVVYIKDEEQVEDMLNVKDIQSDLNDCKIVLEDVTHRYPELKEDATVKIAQNSNSVDRLAHDSKPVDRLAQKRRRKVDNESSQNKRTYRKRSETKEETSAPKRIAKLSQSEVKERLKMLKREKSWQCPHCIKFYHIRKPFEKHLREEHKVTEDEIKEIFKDDEEIGVLDEEIFKCQICSKIYLVEKRLLAHVKLHGPDGKLTHKCPCYCSIYFATKEEAQEHARQSHKDLLYCDICNKYMTGHDSLKNHKSIHHSDKNPTQRNNKRNLVCDKCGKKYSSRTSLTDHVRSDCGRIPLYPCEICGKRLTTAGILKTHLLLHKDDTPFQCDKCGKTFKVKAQYKSHIKTRHTDYKPFKCHLCPKEYPYRESLLTHMTVHTGIKRFLCNGCGKRFTCISNLQAHRKVHADTCGALPLNAKATQYMGVQKGNLLMGAKPEAGLDYKETNTLIAKEVIDRDLPMAQELNYPSEPSAPMVTQPLNYAQHPSHLLLPPLIMPHFIDDSHSSY